MPSGGNWTLRVTQEVRCREKSRSRDFGSLVQRFFFFLPLTITPLLWTAFLYTQALVLAGAILRTSPLTCSVPAKGYLTVLETFQEDSLLGPLHFPCVHQPCSSSSSLYPPTSFMQLCIHHLLREAFLDHFVSKCSRHDLSPSPDLFFFLALPSMLTYEISKYVCYVMEAYTSLPDKCKFFEDEDFRSLSFPVSPAFNGCSYF